jgi:DNA-binding transcriptional ArsR family regulator
MKENFLMVSLEESQAKQLADVLSNATSRKIINHLAEKEEATETEIANALNIPLSTVHYNLQKLTEAQLVHSTEFHYSKKGREVDHYKLANKYVIITPKPVKGIKTALKSILPAALITVVIGGLIHLSQRTSIFMGQKTAAIMESSQIAEEATRDSAAMAPLIANATQPTIALWFIGGALTALIIYLIIRRLRP